jgi:tRNA (guanine10-N2)-dimethyltransferase
MDPNEVRQYLFELSGEHPTMPLAELVSTARAESGNSQTLMAGPGYAVMSLPHSCFDKVVDRLALTRRAGDFLGVVDDCSSIAVPDLPEGSMAIRIRSYEDHAAAWETDSLTRRIGDRFTVGHKVDLKNPDIEIRGIASDRLLLHRKLREVDRKQFERRKVGERPFFSPISLHPRYARALINMTGLRAGDSVLDPFCGTGGVLLEAAVLGMKVYGSDLSPEMIEGCGQNIRHFGLKVERLEIMDIGDVADRFGDLDGVVTDPPYGRATSTNKEALGSLYGRALPSMRDALKVGGGMGIVFPRDVPFPEGLTLEQQHSQRVHKSLTRHYSVLRRH